MKTHTDSAVVEYNEDGSRTVTTVETIYPLTTAEKAQGWGLVGVLLVAPVLPLLIIAGIEKAEEKWNARKAKKSLKSVK